MSRSPTTSRNRVEAVLKGLFSTSPQLKDVVFPNSIKTEYTENGAPDGKTSIMNISINARKGAVGAQTPRSIRRLLLQSVARAVGDVEVANADHVRKAGNVITLHNVVVSGRKLDRATA